MIRLYHRPKAGRPVRAAWTLEEAGAPFEIVRLSMDETRAAEHPAWVQRLEARPARERAVASVGLSAAASTVGFDRGEGTHAA